jgi:MoxR-like ATPase
LQGNPSAACEDIRQLFSSVMRHRVLPSYHAVGEGVTVDDILQHLLETVKEPAYDGGR